MSGPEPGSPEWLAERREGITSTDIPAILGISPWRSEGDVARDKEGAAPEEIDAATARRFRLGLALEDVIAAEEVVEHGIRLRHVRRIVAHPDLPWARTSLDFERIGERTIVETKTTTSRDWDAGLPEHVEAQVRWQMGVARYPRAHVAALRFGSQLACYDIDHDEPTFAGLVVIAEDFRRRLAAGGPFDESLASVRRKWPDDDGSTIAATAEIDEAVAQLAEVRARLKAAKELEEALQTAIEDKMGPATEMVGSGYRITWKKARDSRLLNHKTLALAALELLTPDTAEMLREHHTEVRPGSRRFLLKMEDET